MNDSTHTTTGTLVQVRGPVTDGERRYARKKVDRLLGLAPGPVLFSRVDLTAHTDPARERPAFAKAELDVNGRLVRAHVAAATMSEAVDRLEARLRERLERFAHHEEAKHLRLRGANEHGWRHGDAPSVRPPYFPRPADERDIVRHKTFAIAPMTPYEAVLDLELLDHDFYLFTNAESGADNVIARSDRGGYELFEPSPTHSLAGTVEGIHQSTRRPSALTAQQAKELLDLGDAPFVFFLEPGGRRGRVLYRRYDGHYGLIEPS